MPVWEFYDIIDGVGVVEDKSARLALDLHLTFFAVAFDTAAHKTVIVVAFHEELPESLGTSIILLDLSMWEHTRTLILDKDFLWLHTSQLLNTFVYVTRYQILVAAMELCICFLNEGNPQLMWVLAMAEYGLPFLR